jgi:hypothetical protein
MKRLTKLSYLFASVAILGLASCEKSEIASNSTGTISAIAEMNAIAATADTSSATAPYIINTCKRGEQRDSVAFTALSASIKTYLTANYPGYTFQKAFKVLDTSSAVTAYVVVIQFESNPVGLKFDASGTFEKVLEQRERRDLQGKGWRPGGRFDCRDGLGRDTIALTAIPVGIKTYLSANYAQDTLLHALTVKDGSYVVISANKGLFATIFKSDYSFVKRIQLPAPGGKGTSIAQSALPANITSYLSTTYPSYVFDKAFVSKINSTVQGYVVLLDANGTKYAIRFDASGNFVKNLAIK